jgi:hypothetical protein
VRLLGLPHLVQEPDDNTGGNPLSRQSTSQTIHVVSASASPTLELDAREIRVGFVGVFREDPLRRLRVGATSVEFSPQPRQAPARSAALLGDKGPHRSDLVEITEFGEALYRFIDLRCFVASAL